MLRNIFISKNPIRDIESFNSTFIEGMQMHRYFAYFFLIGSVSLFFIAAFKFKMIFPSLILLTVGSISAFYIYSINLRVDERKDIFLNGTIIYATVKEQGRSFNYLSSSKNYTITVAVNNNKKILIANKRQGLWDDCQIGSQIIGIAYKNKYYFAEEMGAHFKLFECKK